MFRFFLIFSGCMVTFALSAAQFSPVPPVAAPIPSRVVQNQGVAVQPEELLTLAKSGRFPEIRRVIGNHRNQWRSSNPAWINTPDGNGDTLLHLAVKASKVDDADFFINDEHADYSKKNKAGETALQLMQGNVQFAELCASLVPTAQPSIQENPPAPQPSATNGIAAILAASRNGGQPRPLFAEAEEAQIGVPQEQREIKADASSVPGSAPRNDAEAVVPIGSSFDDNDDGVRAPIPAQTGALTDQWDSYRQSTMEATAHFVQALQGYEDGDSEIILTALQRGLDLNVIYDASWMPVLKTRLKQPSTLMEVFLQIRNQVNPITTCEEDTLIGLFDDYLGKIGVANAAGACARMNDDMMAGRELPVLPVASPQDPVAIVLNRQLLSSFSSTPPQPSPGPGVAQEPSSYGSGYRVIPVLPRGAPVSTQPAPAIDLRHLLSRFSSMPPQPSPGPGVAQGPSSVGSGSHVGSGIPERGGGGPQPAPQTSAASAAFLAFLNSLPPAGTLPTPAPTQPRVATLPVMPTLAVPHLNPAVPSATVSSSPTVGHPIAGGVSPINGLAPSVTPIVQQKNKSWFTPGRIAALGIGGLSVLIIGKVYYDRKHYKD